jgi:hypothetical protein
MKRGVLIAVIIVVIGLLFSFLIYNWIYPKMKISEKGGTLAQLVLRPDILENEIRGSIFSSEWKLSGVKYSSSSDYCCPGNQKHDSQRLSIKPFSKELVNYEKYPFLDCDRFSFQKIIRERGIMNQGFSFSLVKEGDEMGFTASANYDTGANVGGLDISDLDNAAKFFKNCSLSLNLVYPDNYSYYSDCINDSQCILSDYYLVNKDCETRGFCENKDCVLKCE